MHGYCLYMLIKINWTVVKWKSKQRWQFKLFKFRYQGSQGQAWCEGLSGLLRDEVLQPEEQENEANVDHFAAGELVFEKQVNNQQP